MNQNTEFEYWENRKRECKELYSDYTDNEFNMVENKFICAIKSDNDKSTLPASFNTLNDFIVYYNRKYNKYYVDSEHPITAIDILEYLINSDSSILEKVIKYCDGRA